MQRVLLAASIRCWTQVELKYAADDPHFDLLKTMTAQMLVVGERYHACGMTPVQFEAEKAAVYSDYRSPVLQRENGAAMADAAQEQAAAASSQAYSANRPRTCNKWGTTVTCY